LTFNPKKLILPTYYQKDQWAISANINNHFLLFATHFFTNFNLLVEEVEVKFSVLKSITSDHIFQHLEPFQLVKMAIVVENFSLKLLENYF
jgi:hypothetical protein